MSKIVPCIYKGGQACIRQGGSGDAEHSAGYTHPIPTLREVGSPAGDFVVTKSVEEHTHRLPNLEHFFDDEFSKSVLCVSLDTLTSAVDLVKKSFYDFDLETDDGVTKLMELLPVMDREILVDIAGEIWPGYPAQDSNPDLLRLEIKGYLMDYLDGHGRTEDAATAPEDLGGEPEGAGGEEPEEAAAGDAEGGEAGIADAGAPDEESAGVEDAADAGTPPEESTPE